MENFTADNWNYVQYINTTDSGLKRAILSIGAMPNAQDEIEFLYFITILDQENNEVFQEEFKSLDIAIHHINKKFSNYWDFQDLTKISDDKSGCSSCVAH